MHISVAVSKVGKWAMGESGDLLEMVERPRGGLSLVLIDGQSSGSGARAVAVQVMRKVISELAEGVRDGAAARAANDMLYAQRGGKVSATLVILSVEQDSHMLIITRCGNPAIFIRQPGDTATSLDEEAAPLGFYRTTRPAVDHVLLEPGLLAVAGTDGLVHAGSRAGTGWYIPDAIESLWQVTPTARAVADGLLEQAMELDNGRPGDDTSVIALHVQSGSPVEPRRLTVEMPLPDA